MVKGNDSLSDGNILTGFLDGLTNNNTEKNEPEGPLDKIAKEVNTTNDDQNCAYIAYAVVARLRGIDPKAVAPAGKGVSVTEVERHFGIRFQPGDFDDIFERVARGGNGTIAIIRIKFPGRINHVVVMANYNGYIGIIEGQYPKRAIVSPDDANEVYNRSGRSRISYGILPP